MFSEMTTVFRRVYVVPGMELGLNYAKEAPIIYVVSPTQWLIIFNC